MADVKELFNTYNGNVSKDGSGSLTRSFVVKGTMDSEDDPLTALEETDLPEMGDIISSDSYKFELTGYNFSREFDSTEAVLVECTYERVEDTYTNICNADNSSARNHVEEQKRRKNTYRAPFDERFDISGEEEEVLAGKDPDTNAIIPLPKAAKVLNSKTIYKFDVLSHPEEDYSRHIGNINSDTYPPVDGYFPIRTVNFAPHTLMFMGASSQPNPIEGIPDSSGSCHYHVQRFTFEFAYNPNGWDIEKFYLSRDNQNIEFRTGDYLYKYDFSQGLFTPIKDESGDKVKNIDTATAEMPLLHRGSDDNPEAPYKARIIERRIVDFHYQFNFYWGKLGA